MAPKKAIKKAKKPSALSAEDFAGEEQAASQNELDVFQKMIDEATHLEEAIEVMTADLKAYNQRLETLKTVLMPDQMKAIGTEKFERNGWEASLGLYVSGGIPKKDPEKREAAFNYLEKLGADGLIKTVVVLNFSKGELKKAQKLCAQLRKQKFDPELGRSVHQNTLHAFVREALNEGKAFNPALLGVRTGSIVKLKKAK